VQRSGQRGSGRHRRRGNCRCGQPGQGLMRGATTSSSLLITAPQAPIDFP
jgi:hypothetical protein